MTVPSSAVITGVGAGAPTTPGVGDSVQVFGTYSSGGIDAFEVLLSN